MLPRSWFLGSSMFPPKTLTLKDGVRMYALKDGVCIYIRMYAFKICICKYDLKRFCILCMDQRTTTCLYTYMHSYYVVAYTSNYICTYKNNTHTHTHTHTHTDLVFADQLLSAVVHLRMFSHKEQDVFENLHVVCVYVDTARTHTHANITKLRSLSFATTTTATHRFKRTKSTSFCPLLAESFAASIVCSVRNFSESFLFQQRHTQETRTVCVTARTHARTHMKTHTGAPFW
jgi:hypothetical protein